jgi:hypothetical protein
MPNIQTVKVCAICGMSKKDHWGRHWTSYHPGASRQELPLGGVPPAPHREDWLKHIEPSSLREKYEIAAKMNEEVPPNKMVDTNAEPPIQFKCIVDHAGDIEIDVEEDDLVSMLQD